MYMMALMDAQKRIQAQRRCTTAFRIQAACCGWLKFWMKTEKERQRVISVEKAIKDGLIQY